MKTKTPKPKTPKKSKHHKEPTIIFTNSGLKGMGCVFEDDTTTVAVGVLPVTQEEFDEKTNLEKIASTGVCPKCFAHLDFNAYENRYVCPSCGFVQEVNL